MFMLEIEVLDYAWDNRTEKKKTFCNVVIQVVGGILMYVSEL